MDKIKNYLKLMRVKHYIKNLLLFLPLMYSRNLLNITSLSTVLIGFLAFSFTCSIVYIINDVKDVEKDRLHFKKKFRPIAANKVSITEAKILIVGLIVIIGLLYFIFKLPTPSILLLLLYLSINLLYSFGLKNIPILDIAILSFGFVLRVLYGAIIINVEVSNWLCLTILAVSVYLSLGKRRNEFMKSKNKQTREVLKYYSKEFLDKNMYMFLGQGLVYYSLWAIDAANNSKYLIWTIPMVFIIVMRYSMIIELDSDGDPVEVVLSDKFLLCCLISYSLITITIFYFI